MIQDALKYTRGQSTTTTDANPSNRNLGGLALSCILLAVPQGTSSLPPSAQQALYRSVSHGTSTGGIRQRGDGRTSSAVLEIRRLSGLTWEQLAKLLGVSRRSVHFWASGKTLTGSNETRVFDLLALLRRIDRGSAQRNRAALLKPSSGGQSPFESLAEGQLDRAEKLLGATNMRRIRRRYATDEIKARTPRKPAELIDALQDRVEPA